MHSGLVLRSHTAGVMVAVAAACTSTDSLDAQPIRGPIREHELRQFVTWLSLTDDQQIIARTLFDEYAAAWRRQFTDAVRRLHAEEQQAIAIVNGSANPGEVAPSVYGSLERTRRELQGAIDAHDATFLDDLASLLTADQIPSMQRVHLGLARTRYRTASHHLALPEARADIIELLDTLYRATPHEGPIRDLILTEEPGYVEVMRLDAEARARRDRDRWKEQAIQRRLELLAPSDPSREALISEFFTLKDQAGQRRIGPAEHLEQANHALLRRAFDVLPPSEVEPLIARFREACHPGVYPDPASATILYRQAREIPGLDPDIHAALDEAAERFSAEHERLSELMAENRNLSAHTGVRAKTGYQNDMYGLEQEYRETGNRRYQLCADQIIIVRAIVPIEFHSQLPEWDFQRHPRARPWDPAAERSERERRPRSVPREQAASLR